MNSKNPSSNLILVTGASGQVGGALSSILGPRAVPLSRAELDLLQPSLIGARLDRLMSQALKRGCSITALFNPAAYTQVDKAEHEEDQARVANAEAPEALARWCLKQDIPLVHYSTDYVFSGERNRPSTEADSTQPLNAYGRTKLEGENRIRESGVKYLIFRTSWVYGATGTNFLKTMFRLGQEREILKIVADQHGAPTYARELAQATLQGLEQALSMPRFASGIYHLCANGETTWHGFATAIFDRARAQGFTFKLKQLEPILTAAYPTPAKRPANSRLNTDKAQGVLGIRLADWREGLDHCLKELKPAQEISPL